MPASWNQNRFTAKLGIEYIAWTDPVAIGARCLGPTSKAAECQCVALDGPRAD
jgi:hypothetical protein